MRLNFIILIILSLLGSIALTDIVDDGDRNYLRLNQNDFSHPFQFQKKVISYLCQPHYSCSLYTFNNLIHSVINSAVTGGAITVYPASIRAYVKTIVYFLQRYTESHQLSFPNTSYYNFTMEKFNLTLLWTPFFHTTIILSGEACSSIENCALSMRESSFLRILTALDRELEDYLKLSIVDIYYGYYLSPSMEEIFQQECSELIDFFLHHGSSRLRVFCVAEFLHLPVESESRWFEWDFRERLAKYAYHRYTASDYYIFLDHSAEVITPGWLLGSVVPLFFGGLTDTFGITSFDYNILSPLSQSGTLPAPLTPILAKGVLAILTNHTFTLPNVPLIVNNLLLIHSLHAVGGWTASDITYSKPLTIQYDPIYGDDYFDQLQLNKRIILSALIKEGLYGTNKDYYAAIVFKKDAEGGLIEFYCEVAAGCIDPFSIIHAIVPDSDVYSVDEVFPLALNRIIQGASVHAVSSLLKSAVFYPEGQIFERKYPPKTLYNPHAKVAVITAIFGNYEASCKHQAKQTVPVNFICFTDNANIPGEGWIIDTVPYHLTILREEFDKGFVQDEFINSYHHNFHPFNIAKYYKLSFPRIPVLAQYEVVIWLDGTISLTNRDTIKTLLRIMEEGSSTGKVDGSIFQNPLDQRMMILFEHIRDRNLSLEVDFSLTLERYTKNLINKHYQPIQPLREQYETYLVNGFRLNYWDDLIHSTNHRLIADNSSRVIPDRPQYGLWVTCFVAFNMRKVITAEDGKEKSIAKFLELWFDQNRRFTTQDQVSFPYVVQQLEIYPYSLPEGEYGIYGSYDFSSLHVKFDHGL